MSSDTGSTRLFFLVGPPRTGSSLMARNIDDHEAAICLCESDVSRALFGPYYVRYHIDRMLKHGFGLDDALHLLSERRQDDVSALIGWYRDCLPMAERLYGKAGVRAFGDKNPAIHDPALVATLAENCPLIYTVRDPRAIVRSIWREDVSTELKEARWRFFVDNLRAWAKWWGHPNLLVTRFEDLVVEPVPVMARVYAHLGLAGSSRFLSQFERRNPCRFIWETNVDLNTGQARGLDPARRLVSDADLPADHLRRLDEDEHVAAYRSAFGYASEALRAAA